MDSEDDDKDFADAGEEEKEDIDKTMLKRSLKGSTLSY